MPLTGVTTTLMVVVPTGKGILADGVPVTTTVPFTFIMAVASFVVGVSCIAVVAPLTATL